MKKIRAEKPVKKEKSRKTEKEYVMKTTGRMRILKITLWCMLGFIFLRGVISCVHPDKTEEINRLITEFKTEFNDTQDRDYEVLAFAQNFVSEYLCYEIGGRDSFISRIKQYVSDRILKIEDIYDFKNSCDVIYAEAYKLEETSTKQVDVFVKAKVQYSLQELQEDNVTYKSVTKIKTVELRVPVYVGSGGYTVEDLPVYVNDTMSCTDYQAESSITLDEIDSEPYEEAVKNFLSAYYGEDQSVLDYFVSADADSSKFKCLGGTFELSKIDTLSTYKNGDGILCIVSYKLTDVINGATVRQQLNMELINVQKRLYVNDYSTKTVNLNLEEE